MTIGKNIRTARKALGITMKELASGVGVSEQAISQYERGLRQPRIELLQRIAAELKVPINALIPQDVFDEANDSYSDSSQKISETQKNRFIQMALENHEFEEMGERLWEVKIKADKAILSAIADIPDRYFLNEIIELFNLLNRRGKYEAYLLMNDLADRNDGRFKR